LTDEVEPFDDRGAYTVENSNARFQRSVKELQKVSNTSGTLYWNIKQGYWGVVRNETTKTAFKVTLHHAIPKAGRSNLERDYNTYGKAFTKWKSHRPLPGCVHNHMPVYPSELPERLCFPYFFTGANQALPHVPGTLLVRTHDPSHDMSCRLHPAGMGGCGAALKGGDLLVLDGRDCAYIGYGVYEVGVYRFMSAPKNMMERGCRVGVARVYYQHLCQIVHKVAMVGYRSPVPNSKKDTYDLTLETEGGKAGGKKRKKAEDDDEWGMGLVDEVSGYAHLHFVDHAAVHQSRLRAPLAPSQADDLYQDWIHVKPSSPPGNDFMGYFGPDLPTMEKFDRAKKRREKQSVTMGKTGSKAGGKRG
jgi:hypothetical protein